MKRVMMFKIFLSLLFIGSVNISQIRAAAINRDYLEIPEKGFPKKDLSPALKKVMAGLQKQAYSRYEERVYTECEVSQSRRENSVINAGALAGNDGMTVYGFIENGVHDQKWIHLVLEKGGKNTPLDLIPAIYLKWADRIPRFKMDRPLVWFEGILNTSPPMLAVREQYHNGTGNAILVQYFNILPDLSLRLAFCMEEKAEDYILINAGKYGTLLRELKWINRGNGKDRLGWEVWSISKKNKRKVGAVTLKDAGKDGSFKIDTETAEDPKYVKLLVAVNVDTDDKEEFVQRGKGFYRN